MQLCWLRLSSPRAYKPQLHLGESQVCLRSNLPHTQAMVRNTPLLSLLLDARVLRRAGTSERMNIQTAESAQRMRHDAIG